MKSFCPIEFVLRVQFPIVFTLLIWKHTHDPVLTTAFCSLSVLHSVSSSSLSKLRERVKILENSGTEC